MQSLFQVPKCVWSKEYKEYKNDHTNLFIGYWCKAVSLKLDSHFWSLVYKLNMIFGRHSLFVLNHHLKFLKIMSYILQKKIWEQTHCLTLKRTDVDGRVADEQRTACCFSRSSCHNKTQQTCSTFEAQTNPLRTPIILFWKSGSSIWFRPRTPD